MSRTRRKTYGRDGPHGIHAVDAYSVRRALQAGREAAAAGASILANPFDGSAAALRIAWAEGFAEESRTGRGLDRGPRTAGEGADFDRSGA